MVTVSKNNNPGAGSSIFKSKITAKQKTLMIKMDFRVVSANLRFSIKKMITLNEIMSITPTTIRLLLKEMYKLGTSATKLTGVMNVRMLTKISFFQ